MRLCTFSPLPHRNIQVTTPIEGTCDSWAANAATGFSARHQRQPSDRSSYWSRLGREAPVARRRAMPMPFQMLGTTRVDRLKEGGRHHRRSVGHRLTVDCSSRRVRAWLPRTCRKMPPRARAALPGRAAFCLLRRDRAAADPGDRFGGRTFRRRTSRSATPAPLARWPGSRWDAAAWDATHALPPRRWSLEPRRAERAPR